MCFIESSVIYITQGNNIFDQIALFVVMSGSMLKILILVFLIPKISVGLVKDNLHRSDTSIKAVFSMSPCIDTLTRFNITHADYNLTTNFVTEISEGNYLSAGYTSTRNPPFRTGGLLTKLSAKGDPLWTKTFFRTTNSSLNFVKAHELPNKDIIIGGSSYISRPVNGTDDLLLIRTTAAGDIVWYRTFQSSLRTDTTTGSFGVKQILSDADNNFYVLGELRPQGPTRSLMVVKFDQNANIIWQKAINLIDLPTITGAFIKRNELWIFAQFSSSVYTSIPIMLRMNKDNGDTLSMKAIYPDFPPPASAYTAAGLLTSVTELSNGNFSLHGTASINGSYLINNRSTVAVNTEVDSNFNFVTANRITSAFLSSGTQTTLGVAANGSAGIHTGIRVASNDLRAYYLHVTNNQLISERYLPFSDYSFGFTPPPVFMKDGSRLFFQTVINSNGKAELMFFKSQSSNRASECTGKDTSLFKLEPFAYKPLVLNSNPVVYSDFLQRTYYTELAAADNIFPSKERDCAQVSFCDTLSIKKVNTPVCMSAPLQLTVVKNSECGATPIWLYDTTVASIQKIKDTIFEFSFKKAWKGYINAQIHNRCGILQDSLYLDVVASPPLPELGTDRTICQGNTFQLKIPSGYASYEWQDGSKDSLFTVKSAGTYFVTVKDFCNNVFTDTIRIAPAGAIPFDVGDVFTKCERETITVKAPDGFTDYTWLTDNGSNASSGQSLIINTDTDTRYFSSAQKTPGCYVYDTIQVKVNRSDRIDLGKDTTLCDGQPLLLDAGTGFSQYQWSNMAVSNSISVVNAGIYAVQATAANGCISKDTIQVNFSKTPRFSLGQDTGICLQTTYRLQPQTGPVFTWQDGTKEPAYTVSSAGLYWLEVNDNGCRFRDSIVISLKPSPVRGLPKDTLLCDQASLLLDPSAFNSSRVAYTWSDGITTVSRNINTSGIYSLTMALDGCTINDTATVSFKFSPLFSLGRDTVICENSALQLNAFVAGASYVWSDFNTSPSITVKTPGLYSVTVSNECGALRDEIMVSTEVCECNVKAPNVFTPNADGINDVFKPDINCVPTTYQLLIFNRNGALLFESRQTDVSWDGTFKGTPVPVGAYFFLVRIKGSSDKIAKEKSGTVLVIR